ncbi:MAG: filamentous hemagglutinin N-terminal domain-containing protein, partial [Caulobacteraceae bacterium]|nr:filamentous hemagglutinin N-terminal domain-containing protein [Caulobacteraceae bacterium]
MIRPAPPQYLRDRRARLVGAASAGVIVWSLASAASALPSGGVIYDPSGSGSGTTITTGSSSVTVDQAGDRVVIDWSTFNIASGESVTFNQPNANAIAFNRVDPTAFTTIDGSLAANGGVWLFSPGGLLFGANAQVNVGSFVGSTAQLQDTDIAAALSGDTVTLSPLANRNGATLTVTNGAQLTATNGFMVLQGETIVQNGSVVSNSDAVWYGVAEGAKITMDTTGAAPDLVDATVQAVAGRGRPSFTQGSTGVTTAHTWVGVSTPGGVESGWQTVINLGGATTAQGAKPGTQDGVVILTGADGVVDLTTSDVHLATAGVLNSVYGVNIDVNSATLDGDIGASGVVAVDLMATDDVVINGDIYGTLVSLTSTGGDLTIGSGSDIEAGQFSAGAVLKMYAYGDLTIASGATVTSLSDMILSVTDAGGTLTVSGSVYAFGTGSNAGNATALFSSGDLEITAGGVVDGAEGVILSSGGPTTISGTVDSTSSTTVLTGDLTVTGTGVVDSDGSTILASYAAGPATMTIDGSVHSGGDTSIRAMVNGADLTIDGTGTVLAAGSLTVSADRDITVDADVAGNVVDIYAGRDFHQTGGTIGFESGLYIAADGDIRTDAGALIEASPAADHSIVYLDAFDSMYLAGDIHGEYVVNLLAQGGNGPGVLEIDGVIYASDRIRVYQDSGEIHLGANADLYTGEPVEYGYPGIWIQGEGAITADAGASIRTPGAYTGAYVNIVANGANGGIDLAADIQSGNVTIQANFDAVDITLSGGSITATDLVAIEGKGNVNVLDGVTIGADYLNIYVNGAAGSQIIFDGDVTTTETIAIRNDDGDVTIGANANLHANSDASTDNGGPLGYQNDTIEITGQDITTVAGSQITVGDAGEPYRGTVQIHSDATNAGGPTQVSLGGAIQAETVGVQVDDGSLDISGSIHTYGDLTFDVSRYFTGDANGDLVTRGYVSISAGLGVDFDGDIHSGGDISIVASGVDADLSLGGMLETPGSIDLSAGGDLSLGAAAYLHSDTDSANANGINIYAYGVVTTAAGSTIVAGQTSDATADVVITAFGHGGGDVEPLDLGGDIYAQGLALSTPYGSIHLRDGDLHVEDSLAIYAYDHFIMDAPASIHAGGDVAITAYYGVQADGAIYAGGDVYLGVYGADADISLGTIEADGSIYISATGDIVLNSGGYLRADANYDGDTDYIYLSAYGRVVTGAGSSMMVGKAGYYTGNVYIGAGASDDPGGSAAGSAIDLSGDIHAGDLLLYADYGSIYLRDGDVVIDQGFDAVSYYDFRIGSNATVHTGGGVDVTAYGEIYAPGSIYADADVLIRGLSTDSNVTVGNIETAGRLSVVNTAAGGDVIVDGYLHSNSDGVGSGDLYLTSDGAVVVDGRLVVGQDSNSVAGAVQITAADDSVSGASAIDLTGDIYADDLYLNTTSGSIHIGPGRIEITSDFSVGAPEDFVTDAGSIIDAYDVLIEAGNNITLDGDIYSQTDIALNRTGSGAGDVTVGGLLHAADVVDIDNRGPGDVVLDGAGIIANSDGDSLGGINITSHLGQVRGASGLLQSGPSSNAYAGYINVTAYGPDGPTSSSIDLAMYMYADDINLSATNGSVHIGEGYVVAGDLFYVYAAGDITIDPYAMIVSGGALELHGAADITVEGDLYANSLILIDSGGDLTINDAAHADSIHLLATGDVSIGADADVIAFYDFTLTMRGAGDVDIYGLVSADYIDISNPYGDIVIGGEVSGGYDAYDPVVHISASGDLTVTDTGYVNGAGDIVLETTGANSALTVDGLISGAGIQLRGSHDIFVGGYIYGGEAITIVSDATNQNDGEIVIDGLVSSLQGISIVNRNTGGVTFDANATVYTYYYVGNCVECYGYRTGSGGTTSLGGLDGDIYIYSAGQVVTVAGSVIDATQGVGSDVGLVV